MSEGCRRDFKTVLEKKQIQQRAVRPRRSAKRNYFSRKLPKPPAWDGKAVVSLPSHGKTNLLRVHVSDGVKPRHADSSG